MKKLLIALALLLPAAVAYSMRSTTLPLPVALFVANPTITSLTPTGGVAGHYTYKIVGVASDGTLTAASAGSSDTAGPTALDGTHFETLVWTDPANATNIQIFRTAGGATQGLIATVASGAGTYDDKGAVGDGSTPSASNNTGAGASRAVNDLADLTVQISGTFAATLQLQGKLSGSDRWQNVGSTQTSPAFVDITATGKTFEFLRVQMTAFTSGTPIVIAAGHTR